MTRKSRRIVPPTEGQSTAPKPIEPIDPAEPRAQDDGFSGDVDKFRSTEPVKYYCRATACPGYEYAASEQPHPFGTCGAIVNGMDDLNRIPDVPDHPITAIDNEKPVLPPELEVVETCADPVHALMGTGFDPTALARQISADMPLLEPSDSIGSPAPALAEPFVTMGPGLPESLPEAPEQAPTLEGILAQVGASEEPSSPAPAPALDEDLPSPLESMGPEAREFAEPVEVSPETMVLLSHLAEGAAELGVSDDAMVRLVDGVVQTCTQCLTFRDLLQTSPVVRTLLQQMARFSEQRGIVPFIRQALEGILGPAIAQQCQIEVEQRTHLFGSLDSKVQQALQELAEVSEDLRDSSTKTEEELQAFGKLCDDIREREQNHQTELKQDILKETRIEVAKYMQDVLRRLTRLENVRAKPITEPDLDVADDDPEAPEFEEAPKKQGKAPKVAEPKRPRGRQPGSKNRPKPKPPSPPKRPTIAPRDRGPHRPKGSKNRPKNRVVLPSQVAAIDKFMGRAKHPKIRELLSMIPPSQLQRFLKTSRNGKPDMTATLGVWNASEKGKFMQWLFANVVG